LYWRNIGSQFGHVRGSNKIIAPPICMYLVTDENNNNNGRDSDGAAPETKVHQAIIYHKHEKREVYLLPTYFMVCE
jgi:hypothetical protein